MAKTKSDSGSIVKSIESMLPKGITLTHLVIALLAGLLICSFMNDSVIEGAASAKEDETCDDSGEDNKTCGDGLKCENKKCVSENKSKTAKQRESDKICGENTFDKEYFDPKYTDRTPFKGIHCQNPRAADAKDTINEQQICLRTDFDTASDRDNADCVQTSLDKCGQNVDDKCKVYSCNGSKIGSNRDLNGSNYNFMKYCTFAMDKGAVPDELIKYYQKESRKKNVLQPALSIKDRADEPNWTDNDFLNKLGIQAPANWTNSTSIKDDYIKNINANEKIPQEFKTELINSFDRCTNNYAELHNIINDPTANNNLYKANKMGAMMSFNSDEGLSCRIPLEDCEGDNRLWAGKCENGDPICRVKDSLCGPPSPYKDGVGGVAEEALDSIKQGTWMASEYNNPCDLNKCHGSIKCAIPMAYTEAKNFLSDIL